MPRSSDAPGGGVSATPARSVLMIAFQFPPFGQSTGRLRTLSMVRHLPDFGWKPMLLTARESAYPQVDLATLNEVPPGAQVFRAPAFDASRVFSIAGMYPKWVATPDRWYSWSLGARMTGRKLIRQHRPEVIWATYPIASAMLAALALHRSSGLPWVADFRDPMLYESWPVSRWDRAVALRIERALFASASAVVVTTPGARDLYIERYGARCGVRIEVIPNGIEDDSAPVTSARTAAAAGSGEVVLLHSGLMEFPDRDPTAFFEALRLLRSAGRLPARGLRVVLRASGSDDRCRALAAAAGVEDIVAIAGRIPYQAARAEIDAASGLLLFQGRACNRQIPAKAYEYLRSGKPIIGLADSFGDTRSLLVDEWHVPYCANMDSPEQIAGSLERFFSDYLAGRAYVPPAELYERYSRRAQASRLAMLLTEVASR